MAVYIVSDNSEGCSPIVLLAMLFPPLLLVLGIYYLTKKIWSIGFLSLFVFCVECAVIGVLMHVFLPSCGICFDKYYCMATQGDTTSLCMKCPSETTIHTCDKIAATSHSYDYVFGECTYQCMKEYSCTDTDPYQPGYFCNVIRDIGITSKCPETEDECEKVVFNMSHYPNTCRVECFNNITSQ